MAVPEARASRHPRLPHPQRGPAGCTVICPSSPPVPRAPLSRTPCEMTPPPTPVPRVTRIRSSTSFPAPKRNSPQAAALASFSTVTSSPVRLPSSSLRGMPSIASRLAALKTLFSRARIKPGTARQTPPTSYPLSTSAIASAMVESSRSRTFSVGYLTSLRSSPSGETTPAAIFVPLHPPLWRSLPLLTTSDLAIRPCPPPLCERSPGSKGGYFAVF